jgi:hypothetical protein
MSNCEKCWSDARRNAGPYGDTLELYLEYVRTRQCTPEEQAGEDARVCALCGRRTVHQLTGECMACGVQV